MGKNNSAQEAVKSGEKAKENKVSAYEKACSYLSHRDHTAGEVRKYLKGEGYTKDEIDAAIEELMAFGAIDDNRYATNYIKYASGKNRGKKRIIEELREKGISRETVEAAAEMLMEDCEGEEMDEYSFESQKQREKALAYAVEYLRKNSASTETATIQNEKNGFRHDKDNFQEDGDFQNAKNNNQNAADRQVDEGVSDFCFEKDDFPDSADSYKNAAERRKAKEKQIAKAARRLQSLGYSPDDIYYVIDRLRSL